MRKTALLLIIVFVMSGLALAQDYKGRARVFGFVYDEEGNPIEGVTVKLYSQLARQGFSVLTNKKGKWLASWIRGGGWRLEFQKIGYEPQTKFITVSSYGKNPEVEVNLKKIEGLAVADELGDELVKGNELYEQGQIAEAREVYMGILEKNPDVYVVHMNIGNCYFQEENYEKAEEHYLKVLEQDADNTAAILAIGNSYQNRENDEKALEWYRKISFDKLEDSTILYNIGVNFFNGAEHNEALKYFKKAVEIDERNLDALYQLGLTYLTLDNKAESIATFEKYLNKDPDSERAKQVKGFLEYLKR
ncbi:MAG: tetratricopeptide repeat protein [Candidatus Aminicenantes bacterium]